MEDMVRLAELVDQGELSPIVNKVFPFNEVKQAHARMRGSRRDTSVVRLS